MEEKEIKDMTIAELRRRASKNAKEVQRLNEENETIKYESLRRGLLKDLNDGSNLRIVRKTLDFYRQLIKEEDYRE